MTTSTRKTATKKTTPAPVKRGPGRPRKPQRTISIETWTWQEAEEALHKNIINRNLRENDVEKYAREMKKKLWGMCAEPVAFDWDGNLINGQHRLHAQVKSKTKQEWVVYRNLPPEEQKHMDVGLPRSPGDHLKFAGHSNTIMLASTARWCYLLEQGAATTARFKVSNEEILDMVDRHPDIAHSAAMGLYARTGIIEVTPTPIAAAHWWIAQHNNHAEADMFIDRFVHMNREQDGSPILALMKRFAEARKPKSSSIPTRIQIAMVIKAWNYDVQRRFVVKMPIYSRTGQWRLQDVLVREVSQDQSIQEPYENPLSASEIANDS